MLKILYRLLFLYQEIGKLSKEGKSKEVAIIAKEANRLKKKLKEFILEQY